MAKQSSWLANQSVRNKLVLAFGLLLGLFSLSSFGSFWALEQRSAARQWTDHTYTVIRESISMELALREQQVGLRGYLISARPAERRSYDSGGVEFDRRMARLRELTADNPAQQVRLQQIDDAVAGWRENASAHMQRIQPPASDMARAANSVVAVALVTRTASQLRAIGELFKQFEITERRLLGVRIAAHERSVMVSELMLLGTLLLGAGVSLLAIYFAERLLAQPLRHMVDLMTRLAGGDHGIDVTGLDRKDEVGAIARALQVFKHLAIKFEQRSWVQSAVSDVSQRLQETSSIAAFADALTAELAPRIGAGLAALHVACEDEGVLKVMGSYGYRPGAADPASPSGGSGLAEQCARERKPIALTSIPADYLHVQSGLGGSAPTVITLLPLLHKRASLGVLEFAGFTAPTEAQQALLADVLPIAALSLENLQRALRTTQLLDHTKAQQEELHANYEELQAQTLELQQSTERLRVSEEELRQQSEEQQASNEQLRQQGEILNEQNRVLEALQRETQDKAEEIARASQYKSEFLANMSHELRTPLNSMLILSRSLADNDDGNLSGDQIESAQVIYDSGSSLLRLINDILDLSKVEAGKMELVLDDFALEELADNLNRNFRHMAAEKGLELEISVDPGLPATLHSDRSRIGQVLGNLLSNAIKFTRHGKVTVHLGRPDAGCVLPAGMQAAHTVAVAVGDTGIGIAADKLDQVFNAFEQADAGTSRQYGGTGLGLSIARSIARLLGGDISVRSEAGIGSTFTLLLRDRIETDEASTPALAAARAIARAPRATTTTLQSIPDDRLALAAGSGETPASPTILIVEDDQAFARILADMIRRKGYRVLAAGNGEEGIDLARRHLPTGILLDVMLPGVDGWTVIDTLKADARTRHIPVHFISAVDEAARARDLGAVGFLTKPVTRDAIAGAFDRLLHFAAGATRHVLIVDDDASARLAVRRLLASDSVLVAEANSGEAALQLMAGEAFDCVILDLGLPGISGFEFLDRVGSSEAPPPVVVYSGRELTREESLRLRQYTDSIVIKGALSPERLLDEVSLFLHSVLPQRGGTKREIDNALVGRKVLLVDDDMRNLFALSKVLRGKGVEVTLAQDGFKALSLLEENPKLELVLMDIMMPGMDGLETMRRIRAQPRLARLPVIALTAKAMQGDRQQCLEAGASDYLTKPVDVDKLLSMMRVWLPD